MMIIIFIGMVINWLLSFLATPIGAFLIIVYIVINLPVMMYHTIWPEKRTEITSAEIANLVNVVKLGDLSHKYITLTIKNRSEYNTPSDIWVACDVVGASYDGKIELGTWVRIAAFQSISNSVVHPHSTLEMKFDPKSDQLLDASGASYISSCTVGYNEEQALANLGYLKDYVANDKQGWWLTVTPAGYQHGFRVGE